MKQSHSVRSSSFRFLSAAIAALLFLSTQKAQATHEVEVLASADGRGCTVPIVSDYTNVPVGGLAQRATVISKSKETNKSSILVEAGDFLFGKEADSSASRTIATAYQFMEYDAVNLGVSDFRLGKSNTLSLVQSAKLPVVSANLFDKPGGQRLFTPFITVDRGGLKVAIIGLTEPPPTQKWLPHLNQQLAGVFVQPLSEALDEVLPVIRKQSSHIVVIYSGSAAGLRQICNQFKDSIDVIVASGSGTVPSSNKPVILAPSSGGRELSRAIISADTAPKTLPSFYIAASQKGDPKVQSILPKTSETKNTPATASLKLPSSLPQNPEPNHLYRIQGSIHNRGADIELQAAGVFDQFGSLKAGNGHQLLVLRSSWENNIPLILSRNQGLATEYRFPNLGDHLYVVINGKTLARLYVGDETIPGELPIKPLSLPYIGMREEGNLVFEIPSSEIESIQLRLYDYAHGHGIYDLLGTPKPPPEPKLKPVTNEVVKAEVFDFAVSDSVASIHADPGTQFVTVDLRAESQFTFSADATAFDPHAKPGSRIQIGTVSDWKEGNKYNHLIVDGKYAFRPREDLSLLPNEPRFLPDLMTGGKLVYQIPSDYQSLTLRADFPNAQLPNGKVIRPKPVLLPLVETTAAPNPSATPLWQVKDDTLMVSIVSESITETFAQKQAESGKTFLVLNVDIENQSDKPEFFQTEEQLTLVDASGKQTPLDPVTYRGVYRPYEQVWIPAKEHRSFEIVYEADATISEPSISYRGFTLAQVFKLTAQGSQTVSTETEKSSPAKSSPANPVQGSNPLTEQVPSEAKSDASAIPPVSNQMPGKKKTVERIQIQAFQEFKPGSRQEETQQQLDAVTQTFSQTAFLSLVEPVFAEFENQLGPVQKIPYQEEPTPLDFDKAVEFELSNSIYMDFVLNIPPSLAKRGRIHLFLANPTDAAKDKTNVYVSIRDEKERYPNIEHSGASFAITDLLLPEGEQHFQIGISSQEPTSVRLIAVTENNTENREAEDNSDNHLIQPLKIGGGFTGRLLKTDSEDMFKWTVTETDYSRKSNLYLEADPAGTAIRCELLDMKYDELQSMTSKPGTLSALVDLSPPPGQYLIRIRRDNSNKTGGYHLLLKESGPAKNDWEREPNDKLKPQILQVIHPGSADKTTFYGQFYGNDDDILVVDVSEPDRVYTLSLQGKGIERISYLDSEGQELRFCSLSKTQQPALVDLHLPLGRNTFRIKGKNGDYVVGIEASPAPGDSFEQEPNDKHRQAQKIMMGSEYRGRLLDTNDTDIFRFVVQQAMDYRIKIKVPDGQKLDYNLDVDDDRLERGSTEDLTPTQKIRLYPGNHFIELDTDKPFPEPYQLEVEPVLTDTEPTGTLKITSGISTITAAAYLDRFQQFEIPFTVQNDSEQPQEFHVVSKTSNYQVSFDELPATIQLGAHQQKTMNLTGYVEDDAASDGPVSLFVSGLDSNDQLLGTWRGRLVLDSNAAALPPAEGKNRIQSSLAGGLNVAATDFGAVPQEPNASSAQLLFDNVLSHHVFDGKTAVVKLAGNGQIPLVGASFDLHGIERLYDGLRDYMIELSDDGQSFHEVVRGQLLAKPGNQDILFPVEMKAKFARLQLLSAQSSEDIEPELGEWRIIAKPGVKLPEFPEMDLLREQWGGHEIWRSDSSVVYGFHHDRAGRIAALEWRNKNRSRGNHQNPKQITIEVSTSSPAGPWQTLGDFDVSAADAGNLKQRIEFKDAPWARFVKVSCTDEEMEDQHPMPAVFEYNADPDYRSLLGEWGGPVQSAGYELTYPKTTRTTWNRVTSSKGKPVALSGNEWTDSTVWINEDWEDWFTIAAPAGKQRKSIEVEGDPFVRVALEAFDESGKPVKLVANPASPGKRVWSLPVGAEGNYRIHVYEPMRSVVFIWDMSGSMTNFLDGIASAVVHFAQEVNPKTERVQLLPLDEPPTPLLPDWQSSPYVLSDTVRNFDPPDSSYAHLSLLEASEMLAKEPGTRAAIVIADCETSREVNPILWKSLVEVQPIVYTFHTTDVTQSFGVEQDDMQDWAAVGGGHYYLIQDPFQLDHAFGKLQTQLRRPAGYRIRTAETTLKKASIELLDNRTPESIEDPFDNGFLLILDMSASMRTVMSDGVTLRSQVAMEGITRIVEQLPDGTQLGIRVFGQRGGTDCASTLLIPVSPLDKTNTIAALKTIRVSSLGNTAIAEALEHATEDLQEVSGKRHIIVMTDGEETCRGDPESAIVNLVQENDQTKVSVVGFMLEDPAVREKYKSWVEVTGGSYYPATDSGSLETVLRNAMTAAPAPTFEVLDSSGNVVATGQVGAGPIVLDSGYYHIRTQEGDTERFGTIDAIERDVKISYYPETAPE